MKIEFLFLYSSSVIVHLLLLLTIYKDSSFLISFSNLSIVFYQFSLFHLSSYSYLDLSVLSSPNITFTEDQNRNMFQWSSGTTADCRSVAAVSARFFQLLLGALSISFVVSRSFYFLEVFFFFLHTFPLFFTSSSSSLFCMPLQLHHLFIITRIAIGINSFCL